MFYKWCPNCHNWHFVEGNSSDFYCPRCHYSWDENDFYWNYEEKEYIHY